LVGVLVPIRQPDDNRIILKLARECNFCKEDDDIYGEEVNIIHPDISPVVNTLPVFKKRQQL
jgi:hypothetical protein